jgi:DNA-binding MarR family transcriptional regulator
MTSGRQIGRECVMFNLRKAARGISRRYEEALRPVDLKPGQFSILAALLDAGDGLPIGRVAEVLGMDRTTLNRNLRPLERRGVVESAPDPEDRRSRKLRITDAGRQLMDEAIPLWRQAQAESFRRIDEARWPALRAELSALT